MTVTYGIRSTLDILICSKAYSTIGLLFRGFVSRDPSVLVKAYKVYVRPILEYCSVVWSPWQIGLINSIESVQRYFTRRLLWPKVMSYSERLAVLELETLELRRLKLDMFYCYKILNNLTCINKDLYFANDCRDLTTRNYDNYRLCYTNVSTNRGSNFYFNRCIDVWNNL